ncbi:hypothetical protein GQ55_1G407400 [Panicum hallii var. hallii]|uniref:Uncharacterized protein n=1 Tax=Panicum hallii var. hallii TaxID=1504633 RepID=A0A2T7FCP7_9POAL|nr:hypothetical protein GQ55_1G407400 [Panicum hallii var. hallii]
MHLLFNVECVVVNRILLALVGRQAVFFMCPPHLICNIAGACCLDYNILFRSLCRLHVM